MNPLGKRFGDLPLRAKLSVLSIFSSSLALLLAGLALVSLDFISQRNAVRRDLTMLSDVIGKNSTVALTFKDTKSAKEILSAISKKKDIDSAAIYDEKGKIFASYGKTVPELAPADGLFFQGMNVTSLAPVSYEEQRIGSIYFDYNLHPAGIRLLIDLAMIAMVLAVSFVISLFISSKFSRMTSAPILDLATTARKITIEKNYSLRGEKRYSDELGNLVDDFNAMLEEIQRRDKQKEDRFQLLVDNVKDYSIMMLDPEGRVVSWNKGAERITGYKLEEVINDRPTKFYLPEDALKGKLEHELKTAIMAERFEEEGWRVRKDGSRFLANVSVTPIRNKDGILLGFGKVMQDITDSKNLQNKILEANRLKSAFLANMSHELRTPLNAIIGFTKLMHSEKTGPISPVQKEYLGDVLTSSNHLLQLINDILDLSKVESGKMEFIAESIDLQKITGEVTDILRGLAGEKRVQIEVKIEPTLTMIKLDPAKLKQILYNYLSNAIKFSLEEGMVSLTLSQDDTGMLRIDVRDNGIGIKQEDIGKLFSEFQQLDSGSNKKYAGTGLGLALIKKLVEAQGGSVRVISELGKGSTFTAILPKNFG